MNINLFEITCANCGVPFWITKDHDSKLRNEHRSFFCPNGHSQWYPGKTDHEIILEKQQLIGEKNNEIRKLEQKIKSLTRKPKKIKEPKK